jgi:dihydrofolate synthase/folylpolyglutamate synthase
MRIVSTDCRGTTFDVVTPAGALRGLRVPLSGEHQASNAALAAAAALAFGTACGRPVSEEAVREGLAHVRISGRLELVQRAPRVLLDAAHNPAETRKLARTLRDDWLRGGAKLHLVCGILADKDQTPMVRALAAVAERAIVTQPPLAERAGDPGRMLRLFRDALGDERVVFEASPERALDIALAGAAPDDVVCVTGSMYLVGALRERWVPEQRILERRTAAL